MAGYQSIPKEDIPKVAGLGALTLGVFGVLVFRLIQPTAVAGPPPPATPVQTASATTTAPAASPNAAPRTPGAPAGAITSVVVPGSLLAPPPSPDMHDPFVPLINNQPTPTPGPAPAPPALPHPRRPDRTARETLQPLPMPGPRITPLPSNNGPVTPMAVPAPSPTAWSVTGVLHSGTENVAILRRGNARRFVRQGDSLDGIYRVAGVTRDSVTVTGNGQTYVLPLGGSDAPSGDEKKNDAAAVNSGASLTSRGHIMVPTSASANNTLPRLVNGKLDAKAMFEHFQIPHSQEELVQEIQAFQQAERESPQDITTHLALALLYDGTGHMDQAIRECNLALRSRGSANFHGDAHAQLSDIYYKLHDYGRSYKEGISAVRLAPQSASAHNFLAQAAVIMGRYSQGEREAKVAIRLYPHSSLSHNSLGLAYYGQGRTDEAIKEFRIALKLPMFGVQKTIIEHNLNAALAKKPSH